MSKTVRKANNDCKFALCFFHTLLFCQPPCIAGEELRCCTFAWDTGLQASKPRQGAEKIVPAVKSFTADTGNFFY